MTSTSQSEQQLQMAYALMPQQSQYLPQQQQMSPQFFHPIPIHQHQHHLTTSNPPESVYQPGNEKQSRPPTSLSSSQHTILSPENIVPSQSRTKGPKVKFSPEEDHLLVSLKENQDLTWKQIAEYFPGRTSGTLQVRKLRQAVADYEEEKWRLVAAKLGSGYSPSACQEKAEELAMVDEEEEGLPKTEFHPPFPGPLRSNSMQSIPAPLRSTHHLPPHE